MFSCPNCWDNPCTCRPKSNDVTNKELESLKKDFENLLRNYWCAITTRQCLRFPKEQEQDEEYAKNLMKKWNIR